MIREVLTDLSRGRQLSRPQAAAVMAAIMDGGVTGAQFGAIAMALQLRGATVDELTGFAEVMRDRAVAVNAGDDLVDTCGTGGDGSDTFNVSTAAAFVVAGAGARVAKHGNRAMSSQCGSADVLEELGVRVELGAREVERTIAETGIGFMFAPLFHPAMRHAAPHRRELRIRTVFNVLGPMTNPARAAYQVIGVADGALASQMLEVLGRLGVRRALVVHGHDGLDEVSIAAATRVHELFDGNVRTYDVTPEQFGVARAPLEALRGGDRARNAAIVQAVLDGAEQGPCRDIVVLNAAAALLAAGRAGDIAEGVAVARAAIDDGSAIAALRALVSSSNRVPQEQAP